MKNHIAKITAALALSLALLLLVPVFSGTNNGISFSAYAASVVESGKCGETVSWSLDSDGTLTVSGTGDMLDFTEAQPAPWSAGIASVKSIIISDGVRHIGNCAFYGCTNAQSISFGRAVESIGELAFYTAPQKGKYNDSLKKLVIGESIKSIGDGAFKNLRAMETLIIENGVESIGATAFDHCTALTSVVIPDSVTDLGKEAFYFCKGLKNAVIGKGVTRIMADTFKNCSSLEAAYIPENVMNIFKSAVTNNKENFTIHVDNDESYATSYARTYDIAYLKHECALLRVVASTCKTQGGSIYGCEVCGYEYSEALPLSGHAYGEWETLVKATCTADGTDKRVCADCGEQDTRAAARLGHSYSKSRTVDTPATTTANGKMSYHCTRCNAKKDEAVIKAASKVSLASTSLAYTGKALKPTVNVLDADGKKIAESNYSVTYPSAKSIGKYTVTVKFKGNYSGTKKLDFSIVPKTPTSLKASDQTTSSLKLSWGKATGATSYTVSYSKDGKSWKTVSTKTNSVTISKLSAGTTYKVKVVAVDKSGKFKSGASTVLTTATKCASPSVTVKSSAKKSVSVSWKKVTGATSYTVYYSTSKDGKYTKLATVTGTSYTNKKLSSGKTYYFKVVANKKVDSKVTLASGASAVKSVKVK